MFYKNSNSNNNTGEITYARTELCSEYLIFPTAKDVIETSSLYM